MGIGEPRKKDREAAIEQINRAYADGLIVAADRSKRIEEVGSAQSMMELQLLLHDLDLRGPAAPAHPDLPTPAPAAAPAESGAELAAAARRALAGGELEVKSRRVVMVVVGVVAVVALSGIGGLVALVTSVGNTVSKTTELVQAPEVAVEPAPVQPKRQKIDLLSQPGVRQLVKAVVTQTGGSTVFDATLYPSYGVLNAPVDSTSQRSAGLYWNGAMRDWGPKGTSRGARVDLARLDPAVVVRLSKRARANLVENATTWYVIVHAPDAQGASIYAYASNEFNEGGYLAATPAGKIVRRTTWP